MTIGRGNVWLDSSPVAWVRRLDGEETRGSAHRRAWNPEHRRAGTRGSAPAGRVGGSRLGGLHGHGAGRNPHRSRGRSPSGPLVVLPPVGGLTARLGGVLPRGGPPRRRLARARTAGPSRPAERGPGVDRARRVGRAPGGRASPVQSGPLQLRGPGTAGPPRTQPLHRGPLDTGSRPPPVRHRQCLAGHHLALRPPLRVREQGRGLDRRGLPRRPDRGLPRLWSWSVWSWS